MMNFEMWLYSKKNVGYTLYDTAKTFSKFPDDKKEKLRNQYENYVQKASMNPPVRKVKCNECGMEYSIPLKANFMFFCPNCRIYNGAECEYGYAAITPCNIFLGDKEIGMITGGAREDYMLTSEEYGISVKLTKGYKNLEVYHEAVDIIKGYLGRDEN
jgi:hypothetical protein